MNREAMAALDYGDDAAHDAFYDALLDDPRMQLRNNDASAPDEDTARSTRTVSRLAPKCTERSKRVSIGAIADGRSIRFGRRSSRGGGRVVEVPG